MSEVPRDGGVRSARRMRTSSQVQHEVTQLILDRGLRPGAPMPTEASLMEQLGVSRNSVREALKALQALDIVEIRHGYGTYVGRASLTPLVDGLTFRTLAQQEDDVRALAEILQIRRVLEEGLMARVAAVITDEQLDELDEILVRMDEAGREGQGFPGPDRVFHETLYRALDNTLVIQLLGVFWDVCHRVAAARGWVDGATPSVTAGRHRDIVTALRNRDAETARRAMADHFQGVESWVASLRAAR